MSNYCMSICKTNLGGLESYSEMHSRVLNLSRDNQSNHGSSLLLKQGVQEKISQNTQTVVPKLQLSEVKIKSEKKGTEENDWYEGMV